MIPSSSPPTVVTLLSKKVNLETTDGHAHFQQRGLVALTIEGTVNKLLTDGNIAYQMYEQGVVSKVDSGAFAYFKCTNKGCDPSQPMYLTLEDPVHQIGKGFTAEFPLQLPYQQKTGQMTVSIIGSDQDHQPSDFTIGVSFNYTNTKENGVEFQGTPKIEAKFVPLSVTNVKSGGKTECQQDVDCPSSYCMVKTTPPFFCHDCGKNCCNSDADCVGSYCMDDPSKSKPYSCHAASMLTRVVRTAKVQSFQNMVGSGGKTDCNQDVDCPSSYCMRGAGKKRPYHCHDCGENCCNSDSDCPGSYCMDSPGKVAPYTCH